MFKTLLRIIRMYMHRNRMRKVLAERINYNKPLNENYGNSFDQGSPRVFES